MIHLQLYKYGDDNSIINKQLNDPIEIIGLLYESTNVLYPVIELSFMDTFNFNYCYIEELNRYYFVKTFRVLNSTTYEVQLSIDVLKSYEKEILKATGTIENKENANKFLSNSSVIFDKKPNYDRLNFDGSAFKENGSIIMVTLKGL